MKNGEKISVAQIDYQEFDEENFQYVIIPYWDIIDGLPASVFQGLPGIDMELRLDRYYRVNYIPVFITERTPSENREDLWEIVERRRESPIVERFSPERLPALQYGDRVIVDSLEQIGDTTAGFADNIFTAVTNGVDIVSQDGDVLVGMIARSAMVSVAVTQRILEKREYASKRRAGIEQAKKMGSTQAESL